MVNKVDYFPCDDCYHLKINIDIAHIAVPFSKLYLAIEIANRFSVVR